MVGCLLPLPAGEGWGEGESCFAEDCSVGAQILNLVQDGNDRVD
jgi:hypothetical protein